MGKSGRAGHAKGSGKKIGITRQFKTKHYKRDIDQVFDDLNTDKAKELENQVVDPDLPGYGQNYCIQCARHFITQEALVEHRRSKPHKRRVKELRHEPYRGPDLKIDNGKPIKRDESHLYDNDGDDLQSFVHVDLTANTSSSSSSSV